MSGVSSLDAAMAAMMKSGGEPLNLLIEEAVRIVQVPAAKEAACRQDVQLAVFAMRNSGATSRPALSEVRERLERFIATVTRANAELDALPVTERRMVLGANELDEDDARLSFQEANELFARRARFLLDALGPVAKAKNPLAVEAASWASDILLQWHPSNRLSRGTSGRFEKLASQLAQCVPGCDQVSVDRACRQIVDNHPVALTAAPRRRGQQPSI